MIPTGGVVDFNTMCSEVGISGTKHLGEVFDIFNQYTTGAAHSEHSSQAARGFTGANIWHFLQITSAQDLFNGYIRVTVTNYSQLSSQSGTLDWLLRDASNNTGGSGSTAVTVNAGSSATYDLPWATYPPNKVLWRWSASLSYNQINF